jgi:hypothetical protein
MDFALTILLNAILIALQVTGLAIICVTLVDKTASNACHQTIALSVKLVT